MPDAIGNALLGLIPRDRCQLAGEFTDSKAPLPDEYDTRMRSARPTPGRRDPLEVLNVGRYERHSKRCGDGKLFFVRRTLHGSVEGNDAIDSHSNQGPDKPVI